MAIVKKSGHKKKKKEDEVVLKATKQDKAVATHLYENVNKRIGDLAGQEVKCFYAEDAVNVLLDSKWATGSDALFTDRQSCVDFCHLLLCKEMFHRAVLMRKPNKAKVDKIKSLEADTDTPAESSNEVAHPGHTGSCCSPPAKTRRSKKKTEKKESDKTEGDSKKLKKLKLDPQDIDQFFYDGREIYVWVYEPTPFTTYLIGSLMLVGCIAMCCYPLWPQALRDIVYYLSVLGAVFLGVILFLSIFRYVVYYIVLGITFQRHKFFLFPNLTEDCGFFESFVPVFEYSRASDEDDEKSNKKKSDKLEDHGEANDEPGEDETEELEERSEPIEQADGDKEGSEENTEGSTEGSTEGNYDVVKKSDF